ncbi:MAG: rhomboid family intramembrane serine protease [Neomegalonema sp.]
MFPIRDHNPSQRTPFVTYALIALNVLSFVSYAALFNDERALRAFFEEWAMIPAAVSGGEMQHTLVTSMFLHGGLMHLGGNMLFLWIFGDNLEDALGHLGFLIFYLATGLVASAAHISADAGSIVPTVGASGAISGVMGGYLLLYPKAKVDVFVFLGYYVRMIVMRSWAVLGIWFALQLVGGFSTLGGQGGVAYWAHAGGFIAGLAVMLPLWAWKGGPRLWRSTEGHRPGPPTAVPERGCGRPPVVRRRR